jgi:hypothetical protein
MRKTKLVVDHELEANVIGIVTTLKDYKLAWNINQVFKINLIMQPTLQIKFIKGNDLSIVNFLFKTEFQQFRLIKNRSSDLNSGFLIPELSNFDFFLMLSIADNNMINEPFIEKLHSIKGMEYIQIIDVDKLKSKDNFIF